jgi:serine/threonine protein kinase
VIHRDITPMNVWLETSSPMAAGAMPCPIRVKLMDFGLAKDLLPEAQLITEPGQGLGTLGYIAPEQRR